MTNETEAICERAWPSCGHTAESVCWQCYTERGRKLAETEAAVKFYRDVSTDDRHARIDAAKKQDKSEAETERLRRAMPPPARLRQLANWFDLYNARDDVVKVDDVQTGLRRWADAIEAVSR